MNATTWWALNLGVVRLIPSSTWELSVRVKSPLKNCVGKHSFKEELVNDGRTSNFCWNLLDTNLFRSTSDQFPINHEDISCFGYKSPYELCIEIRFTPLTWGFNACRGGFLPFYPFTPLLCTAKKNSQLPAVDEQHAPVKLPSKLHRFTCVYYLAQSLCITAWLNQSWRKVGLSKFCLQGLETKHSPPMISSKLFIFVTKRLTSAELFDPWCTETCFLAGREPSDGLYLIYSHWLSLSDGGSCSLVVSLTLCAALILRGPVSLRDRFLSFQLLLRSRIKLFYEILLIIIPMYNTLGNYFLAQKLSENYHSPGQNQPEPLRSSGHTDPPLLGQFPTHQFPLKYPCALAAKKLGLCLQNSRRRMSSLQLPPPLLSSVSELLLLFGVEFRAKRFNKTTLCPMATLEAQAHRSIGLTPGVELFRIFRAFVRLSGLTFAFRGGLSRHHRRIRRTRVVLEGAAGGECRGGPEGRLNQGSAAGSGNQWGFGGVGTPWERGGVAGSGRVVGGEMQEFWVWKGGVFVHRGDYRIIVSSSGNKSKGKIRESTLEDHQRQNIHSLFPGCSVQIVVTRELKPKSTQYTSEKDTQLPIEMVFLSTACGGTIYNNLCQYNTRAPEVLRNRTFNFLYVQFLQLCCPVVLKTPGKQGTPHPAIYILRLEHPFTRIPEPSLSAMCMKLGVSNGCAKYYHCDES
ncbi:putative signal peptide protein [Puccinia sorghi]|uniref:Putative signal peptide protein n=1 Tax=Puccinia sorghi TaxID=27349 RepID=A0A0L6VKI3_9BASI|nr:putative signal peptide protein [Puccinia sorghi]